MRDAAPSPHVTTDDVSVAVEHRIHNTVDRPLTSGGDWQHLLPNELPNRCTVAHPNSTQRSGDASAHNPPVVAATVWAPAVWHNAAEACSWMPKWRNWMHQFEGVPPQCCCDVAGRRLRPASKTTSLVLPASTGLRGPGWRSRCRTHPTGPASQLPSSTRHRMGAEGLWYIAEVIQPASSGGREATASQRSSAT